MSTTTAPLPSIGFWSYARTDDESSGGRLSALRAAIEKELQQKVGKTKVQLFQDKHSIPLGTEWKREIDSALASSSFLLVILSPALLESPECAYEIAAFRHVEARLGRRDLVFPIHYLDIEEHRPGDHGVVFGRELFSYLRERQWLDFREERLLRLDDEQARRKIASIALAVSRARRGHFRAAVPTSERPETRTRLRRLRHVAVPSAAIVAVLAGGAWLGLTSDFKPWPPAPPPVPSPREEVQPPRAAAPPQACDHLAQLPRTALGAVALVDGVPVDRIELARAQAACQAALRDHPQEPRFQAAMARLMMATGSPGEALPFARRAAEADHPVGKYLLGLLLADPRGAAHDPVAATRWLRQAAQHGIPIAQFEVGRRLQLGIDGLANSREALAWYRRAADQGYAPAQFALGVTFRAGLDGAADPQRAVEWFRLAAQQDHVEAQVALAALLEEGFGTAPDAREAAMWYRRAANAGHARAQRSLAFLLSQSPEVPRDDREATIWYRRAAMNAGADAGDRAVAQLHLARRLRDGAGTAADPAEALDWFRRAAAPGGARAQADARAQRALDEVVAEAQYDLAIMLRDGQAGRAEAFEARRWFREAAERGHVPAQNMLGAFLEEGRGGPRDLEQAVEWYQRAARSGDAAAQSNLRRLGRRW